MVHNSYVFKRSKTPTPKLATHIEVIYGQRKTFLFIKPNKLLKSIRLSVFLKLPRNKKQTPDLVFYLCNTPADAHAHSYQDLINASKVNEIYQKWLRITPKLICETFCEAGIFQQDKKNQAKLLIGNALDGKFLRIECFEFLKHSDVEKVGQFIDWTME